MSNLHKEKQENKNRQGGFCVIERYEQESK